MKWNYHHFVFVIPLSAELRMQMEDTAPHTITSLSGRFLGELLMAWVDIILLHAYFYYSFIYGLVGYIVDWNLQLSGNGWDACSVSYIDIRLIKKKACRNKSDKWTNYSLGCRMTYHGHGTIHLKLRHLASSAFFAIIQSPAGPFVDSTNLLIIIVAK